MKKKDSILREYVRSINDEDLKFLCSRLSHTYGRRGGDVADAAELIQNGGDIDRLFSTAKDSEQFFDLIDEVQEYAEREIKRRILAEREAVTVV